MVLNTLSFLIVAFLAFIVYHIYKIAKKEQIRIDTQEAAYKRFLEDNAIYPPISTKTITIITIKFLFLFIG